MPRRRPPRNQSAFNFNGAPKPDPPAARAARDEGVRKVAEHNEPWTEQAKQVLTGILGSGRCMTGEEARIYVVSQIGRPHGHHNVWGSVILSFVMRGLITRAGWGRMKTEKSHARGTPIWRW